MLGRMPQPPEEKTVAEWKAWLTAKSEQFLEGYRVNPDRFLSDKAAERTASRDYHGREILELLQNANDAAAEADGSSKVCIELSRHGLLVANTGRPFTAKGIRSLMLAHLSSKARDGQLIGNKGLGFRAVLNWSNRPTIFSGELRLGFAPEFAQRHDLNAIRSAINEEKNGHAEPPTLQFPAFLDAFHEAMPDSWVEIHRGCRELRESHDSVIGLPFDRADAFDEALAQISQLGPEVLLFVANIESLTIQIPDSTPKEWSIIREGDEAIVSLEDGTSRYWTVWEEKGEIPDELRIEDGPKNYELAFATSDEALPSRRLFCHFETKVDFPYPLVCHATFELDQARNHLIQSPVNAFVLSRLAALHAEVVEKIASRSKDWSAAKLASSREGGSTELFEGGDYKPALVDELAKRAFLPCMDGGLRKPADAAYVPGASATWLPTGFEEVVNLDVWPKSDSFVRSLAVAGLSEERWLQRIEEVDFTNHDKLAALIAGMGRNGAYGSFASPPSILLDGSGNRVRAGRVYVAGARERPADPPTWLTLRFLNPSLRERLQANLTSSVGRDLVAILRKDGFDVDEYNTTSVSYAAVADAKTAILAEPHREREIRHELLAFLFRLFQTVKAKETAFTAIAGLLVPTVNGEWHPAADTHFSGGYGEDGQLLEELYGACLPDSLIAGPHNFEWAEDKSQLADFLAWIGVHARPRTMIRPAAYTDRDFLEHVRSGIPDTFYVEDEGKLYTKAESESEMRVEMTAVFGMDKILATAASESILAWVLRDGRWSEWQTASKNNGVFSFKPYRAQYRRKVKHPLPSYPYWLLQRTPWLTGDDGERHAPTCLIQTADTRVDGLLPRPVASPTPLLPENRLFATLIRAGVAQDITHLPASAHFAALRRCEASEVKASAYYRFLLLERKQAGDIELLRSTERGEFCRSGIVWCDYQGARRLVPVADARYRSGDDIPRGVSQYIPIALLPVKRRLEGVDAIFGIKTLRQSQFLIADHKVREGSERIQDVITAAAPHIIFLRDSVAKVTKPQREAIENLRIFVCSEVSAQFSAEGLESRAVSMSPHEWVLDHYNGFFVVCPEGEEVSVRNTRLIAAMVDAIASIFGIGDGLAFEGLLQAADEHQRITILATRLGDATPEIIAQFAEFRKRADTREEIPIAPSPTKAPPAATPPPAASEPSEDTSEPDDKDGAPAITGDSVVNITDLEHKPASGPRIPLRVTRSKRIANQTPLITRRPANGDRAEDVAEAFERGEGRFPVRVGHMTGWKAAGCDILSYDTKELAEAARTAKDATPVSTACRLIEVKGRSDGRARIALDGNEFATATREPLRYFLYRVFEDDEADSWQVAILPNPAHAYNSHVPTLVVDLEASAQTQKYVVTITPEGSPAAE